MNINKVEELAKKIYGVNITKNPLGNPMYEFTGTELAMFAELIVKECAGIDFRHKIGLSSDQDYEVSNTIKKHFGVEE